MFEESPSKNVFALRYAAKTDVVNWTVCTSDPPLSSERGRRPLLRQFFECTLIPGPVT